VVSQILLNDECKHRKLELHPFPFCYVSLFIGKKVYTIQQSEHTQPGLEFNSLKQALENSLLIKAKSTSTLCPRFRLGTLDNFTIISDITHKFVKEKQGIDISLSLFGYIELTRPSYYQKQIVNRIQLITLFSEVQQLYNHRILMVKENETDEIEHTIKLTFFGKVFKKFKVTNGFNEAEKLFVDYLKRWFPEWYLMVN